jgi:uncharacterized membrane protein
MSDSLLLVGQVLSALLLIYGGFLVVRYVFPKREQSSTEELHRQIHLWSVKE